MNIVSKMMNISFKMTDFVFQMIDFVTDSSQSRSRPEGGPSSGEEARLRSTKVFVFEYKMVEFVLKWWNLYLKW